MRTYFNKGKERVHKDAWEKNILERRENKHNVDEVRVGKMPVGGIESVSGKLGMSCRTRMYVWLSPGKYLRPNFRQGLRLGRPWLCLLSKRHSFLWEV